MEPVKLSLNTEISFNSFPLPKNIVIPIPDGKVGPFKYKQHEKEPLSVEPIKIQHAGDNRLEIILRGKGKLNVKNLPDPSISGAKIELQGGIVLKDLVLCIENLKITRFDLKNIPGLIDELIRKKFNEILGEKLSEQIEIDLKGELEKLSAQINRPNPINFKIGKESLKYEFIIGLDSIVPALEISPGGLNITFEMSFFPKFEQPKSTIA